MPSSPFDFTDHRARLDRRRTAKRGLLFTLAVICLLLSVLWLAGCGRKIPTSQPAPVLKVWVAVSGKSMLPNFPESGFVEMEIGVPFDALKAGDTAIFWDYTRGQGLTHHRCREKQAGSWIMQGDNPGTNPVADRPWMTRDNYYGRTTGRAAQWLIPGNP